jgi:YVTN family beta-propeller protein
MISKHKLYLFLISTTMILILTSIAGAFQDAYITNYWSNNVSVINTTNNTVYTNVAVGDGPRGVAVTPDRSTVYVANEGGNVSVINTINNTA